MANSIDIKFMVEKSAGKGEDSEPVLFSNESTAITGVFDGMGGSGATLCNSDYGEGHSKAYVASRIIREAIDKHIHTQDLSKITSEVLKEICDTCLKSEMQKYPSEKSMLRSKIVREYPTTLTLIVSNEITDSINIDSYWAGDSRNFLWTKEGFYQISQDDLINGNDPLENLSNDSALSNCVCANIDFIINHKNIKIGKQPYVILSATDGCFGYLRTPMHFEQLLASTLQSSSNQEEWEKVMKDQIQETSGDDYSISLIARGFEDFNGLKMALGKRANRYAEAIDSLQERIEDLQNELKESEQKLKNTITSNWKDYKASYLMYLTSTVDNGNSEIPKKKLLKKVMDFLKRILSQISRNKKLKKC